VHATPDRTVRLLSSGVPFASVPMGAGWRIDGCASPTPRARMPGPPPAASSRRRLTLGLTGALVPGRPDTLGVTTARPVRFGRTGLVLTSVAGSVQGLVRQAPKPQADRLRAVGLAGRHGAVEDPPSPRRHGYLQDRRTGRVRSSGRRLRSRRAAPERVLFPSAAAGELDARSRCPAWPLRGRHRGDHGPKAADRDPAACPVGARAARRRRSRGITEQGAAGFADVCVKPAGAAPRHRGRLRPRLEEARIAAVARRRRGGSRRRVTRCSSPTPGRARAPRGRACACAPPPGRSTTRRPRVPT
jgi:hypothetical protein